MVVAWTRGKKVEGLDGRQHSSPCLQAFARLLSITQKPFMANKHYYLQDSRKSPHCDPSAL